MVLVRVGLNYRGITVVTGNNNVIENGIVSITGNNNNIDNDRKKYERGRRVEILADEMLQALGANQSSRQFMCKVAWKLSEARIWGNIESAKKGRNPMGLFIYLCKRDGV